MPCDPRGRAVCVTEGRGRQHGGFPRSQGSPALSLAPWSKAPRRKKDPLLPPPIRPLSGRGGRCSLGGSEDACHHSGGCGKRRVAPPPHAHGPRFGEKGRQLAVTESSIQHQASIWSSASSWRQLFHSGGDLRAPRPLLPGQAAPPSPQPPEPS